jgi:hypothetical protein
MSIDSQIQIPSVSTLPNYSPDLTIVMLKPDIQSMPDLTSKAAQDILLGLGDVLTGKIHTEFYTSPHFAKTAQWALDRRGIPQVTPEIKRGEIVMGLEGLRVEYTRAPLLVTLEPFICQILNKTQFTFEGQTECQFTEPWIRRLYTNLNPPDLVYGELWKQKVISALQEGPLKFIFMHGPLDHVFVDVLKDVTRKTLRNYGNDVGNLAKNIIHAPDANETNMVLDILKDYFSQ